MAGKNRLSEKSVKTKKRSILVKILRFFLGIMIFGIICAAIAGGVAYHYYLFLTEDLPKISTLKDCRLLEVTCVYSDDNHKIAEFYIERRFIIPLSEMPDMLIQAFVAAEDDRFFEHQGVDIESIIRAFYKNIKAGAIVQGGSTITQQVTKRFLLSPEKSFERKAKEAILAYRIEKKLSKEEILFLYLNQIYLGHGAYGVEAAAQNYFGKSAISLNLAECAMMAGLPRAPSDYSPFKHPEKAKERQIYVLNQMAEEKYITQAQIKEALNTKIDIHPRKNLFIEKAPYFTEHVRRSIEEKYGREMLYTGGLNIYTTVNVEMQNAARIALDKGLRELDKRQGYRGPIKTLAKEEIEKFSKEIHAEFAENPPQPEAIIKGVVIEVNDTEKTVFVRMGKHRGIIKLADMDWARKVNPDVSLSNANKVKHPGNVLKTGDVIYVKIKKMENNASVWELALEQTPEVQGALMCIETGTGNVKAMVGGRDFSETQFNRAIQAKRQPGSSFKSIFYAAAIDKGYTPATQIIDNAIVKIIGKSKKWKPEGYDRTFHGQIPLREALAQSRNLASIRILEDIGVDYAVEYAKKLGITSDLDKNLSMALGTSGVSLLEMVTAYSVFANHGYLIRPVFIIRTTDRESKELQESVFENEKVIEETTAYIMTSLLESVVNEGTGQKVRAIGRPAAGKTGTTNDLRDAWFIGYTPEYICGVWVGFDQERSLGRGESGGKAASPIWLYFMKQILEGKPVKNFDIPPGIVHIQIDESTGLLPISETVKKRFECFKIGTEPKEHSQKPDAVVEKDLFYKMDI